MGGPATISCKLEEKNVILGAGGGPFVSGGKSRKEMEKSILEGARSWKKDRMF